MTYLTIPAPTGSFPHRTYRVVQVGLGQLGSDSFALHDEQREGAVRLTTIEDDRARFGDDVRNLVMVAFQFGIAAGARLAAMKAYVGAREPALARHGGRLVFSALSDRGESWPFDGIEILDFPSPDGVQLLTRDEGYASDTKQASKVFAGDFAMAVLALS